jgi:hypothetical protein
LCRYYTVFRWSAFVEYWLGTWSYIICLCVCLVLLSVEDLFVNCHSAVGRCRASKATTTNSTVTVHKQIFHWQEHQAHTQIDDIHIRPRTKSILNERRSAEDSIVTAQSTAYGPLKMIEHKRPKHVGVSCVYKQAFNILVFFKCYKVSIF